MPLLIALTACGTDSPTTGVSGAPVTADAGVAAPQCTLDTDCVGGDRAVIGTGNPCDGTVACISGRCAIAPNTAVVCADGGELCQVNACDPASRTCVLKPRNSGASCEDGDPCTVGDVCAAGACKAGLANACACQSDGDCGDDGDACNGTSWCNKGVFPFRCEIAPKSVVVCPADTACAAQVCEPTTGKCGPSPKNEGGPCDDGETCTQTDRCKSGECAGGDNTCACKKAEDCGFLDGGSLCAGTHYCELTGGVGACVINPATVVKCAKDDDTACVKNTCNNSNGLCQLAAAAAGSICDDGDVCTTGDACNGGVCVGGTNTCACKSDKDCAGKDDGDSCNGTLFCNVGEGTCELNPAGRHVSHRERHGMQPEQVRADDGRLRDGGVGHEHRV